MAREIAGRAAVTIFTKGLPATPGVLSRLQRRGDLAAFSKEHHYYYTLALSILKAVQLSPLW